MLNTLAARSEFKQRFIAWWHGYDYEETPPPAVEEIEATPGSKKSPLILNSYAQVVELIWPEGFCSPGDAESIVELTKPLRLAPELSMLDIGAGFGGCDRAIAATSGVYVTGMEENREFIERGNHQIKAAGQAKHVALAPFDPETFELPERKYDRVFSKEYMFNFADKPKVFTAIFKSLRSKGEFLFTDYLMGAAPDALAKIDAWLPTESGKRYPVTFEIVLDHLKLIGFDVRISDDVTDAFIGKIHQNFQRLSVELPERSRDANMDPRSLSLLNQEIGVWLRRVELLQSHALRVYRFHAIMPESGKMMSNW
jgi:cyclopropane fatty-acyl-phospholipid synthase-like methyltransferase